MYQQEKKDKEEKEKKEESNEEKKEESEAKAPASEAELATEVAQKMMEELTKEDSQSKDGEDTKAIVKRAAQAVGSLNDTEFSISFNPDVFQPHVTHANPEVS